jgi:hypothetical protein
MKSVPVLSLFLATAYSFGQNVYDSYFYDDAWYSTSAYTWNDNMPIFQVGGTGDFDFQLMTREREDREGKYYAGKYGPAIELFFEVSFNVYFAYLIDFDFALKFNGFKIVPARYSFKKEIGGKTCSYFDTYMEAAGLYMEMRENITQYYISLTDILENGTSFTYKGIFADQAEDVNWPEVDALFTAWDEKFGWFDFCL